MSEVGAWWTSTPPTLTDVARMIDHIQESLVNQGTVVVKQPDVWSQARMTKFRKEFEDTMALELTKFQPYINARIARSDAAALQSQTSLAAAIAGPGAAAPTTPALSDATALLGTTSTLPLPNPTATLPAGGAVTQDFSLLNKVTPAGSGTATAPTAQYPFGLEPNVVVDERADYITHLQRLRRINLGDDNADSAGYGLYLMRVPVSIQPGDKTKKGFGALASLTVRHDFAPGFLPATYRNLVINDLIDQLGPVIYDLIRSGLPQNYNQAIQNALQERKGGEGEVSQRAMTMPQPGAPKGWGFAAASRISRAVNSLQSHRTGPRTYAIAPSDVARVFVVQNLLNLAYETQVGVGLEPPPGSEHEKLTPPSSRDLRRTDVMNYLRHQLEAAYDLMEGRCRNEPPPLADVEFIESLADQVYCRKFEGPKGTAVNSPEELNEFYNLYESFTHRLPGNLRFRGLGVLCWAIAIDAGLLNRQLHSDMAQTKGADGALLPPEVQDMTFYLPTPPPEMENAFEQYVTARWPMITFALEPVIDEQNIDDAFTRRRDLQLAIAFALAAGRLSFRQAIQYTRQLQYEAQTIALNQTVAAFAHGNDTFGWRMSPRYQTPPEESNLRAVTNMLLRGGPGPNYQLANSKIEPGLREMTAVVVMPSFVRRVRMDVMTNWYRLSDPDERKIHTARTVEIGRRINETRDCLTAACQCGKYRPGDIDRLLIRLYQLEQMLPMQTQFIQVPFENTLGGFALFTPGQSALVPELTGFEGIDALDISKGADIIVYGKHFSIYESAVVVGGNALPREGTGMLVSKDTNNSAVTVVNSVTPLRDTSNNLYVFKSDGTPLTVKDNGSFDIISREVMRVRIPANVQPSMLPDRTQVVEVYVSTPNGISNSLRIPITTSPDPAAAAAAASPAAFTLKTPTVTVAYTVTQPDPKAPLTLKYDPAHSSKEINLAPLTPGLVYPKAVSIKLQWTSGPIPSDVIAISGGYQPDKNQYSVPFQDDKAANPPGDLATQLMGFAVAQYSATANPNLKTKSVTVSANFTVANVSTDLAGTAGTTDVPLSVTILYIIQTPPHAAASGASPAQPKPLAPGATGPSASSTPAGVRRPTIRRDEAAIPVAYPVIHRTAAAAAPVAASVVAQAPTPSLTPAVTPAPGSTVLVPAPLAPAAADPSQTTAFITGLTASSSPNAQMLINALTNPTNPNAGALANALTGANSANVAALVQALNTPGNPNARALFTALTNPSNPNAPALLSALTNAGNPNAQGLLTALIDPTNPNARDLVNALTNVGNPNAGPLIAALTNPNTAGLLFQPTTAATAPSTHTTLVVPPRAPVVNVTVPINNARPAKTHNGLFHRRNATPQNPARPPLMERLLGNP